MGDVSCGRERRKAERKAGQSRVHRAAKRGKEAPRIPSFPPFGCLLSCGSTASRLFGDCQVVACSALLRGTPLNGDCTVYAPNADRMGMGCEIFPRLLWTFLKSKIGC